MPVEDYWPDDLLTELPLAPKDILEQQAGLLGEKTKNMVLADVEVAAHRNDRFLVRFVLRVPALNNYRLELMTLTHGIDLYPVKTTDGMLEFEDEAALKDYVSHFLKLEETKKIIRALITQAQNSEHPPF